MHCIIDTIMPNPYLPTISLDPSYASPVLSSRKRKASPPSEQITKMDIPQSLLKKSNRQWEIFQVSEKNSSFALEEELRYCLTTDKLSLSISCELPTDVNSV